MELEKYYCDWCGTPFEDYGSKFRKFCSGKCYYDSLRKNKIKTIRPGYNRNIHETYIQTSLYLPRELIKKTKIYCIENNIKPGALIRNYIETLIKEDNKKNVS